MYCLDSEAADVPSDAPPARDTCADVGKDPAVPVALRCTEQKMGLLIEFQGGTKCDRTTIRFSL